ncbi:uncharacterized protein TNCV_2434831 [Trichonephila clavipes]|nr:uncharacterized protein TNCV_2434831 [Trichonephila clavipes]
MPKFKGPYRVLEVRNNNLTIWKWVIRVTVNIVRVRMYHPRHSDTNSFDSTNETLYEGKGSSKMGRVGRTRENTDVLENPRVMRGPETLPGTSNQRQMRRFSPPKEESRRRARVQSGRARETRTKGSKEHSAAEGRPVQSRKTTVRPCPYYLRCRFKEPEGLPEEQRSTGINSLPQNSLRKRSLSMEAIDGDPADRST